MKWVLVAALSLSLAACGSSVPLAPSEEDAAGKRFDAPPTGKVAFYIVRPSKFNFAYAINVSVGQRMAGSLGGESWLRVDVEPGKQDVRCQGENTDATLVEANAGEIRFVLVRPNMGWSSARCSVQEVDAVLGRSYVMSSRRVQEIR